jgi:hypothetical protein
LEKQEFLSKVVPDLSLDSLDYEINKLVIKDSRLGRFHNVYFQNFQMCVKPVGHLIVYIQDMHSHLTIFIDYESTTTYHRLTAK